MVVRHHEGKFSYPWPLQACLRHACLSRTFTYVVSSLLVYSDPLWTPMVSPDLGWHLLALPLASIISMAFPGPLASFLTKLCCKPELLCLIRLTLQWDGSTTSWGQVQRVFTFHDLCELVFFLLLTRLHRENIPQITYRHSYIQYICVVSLLGLVSQASRTLFLCKLKLTEVFLVSSY